MGFVISFFDMTIIRTERKIDDIKKKILDLLNSKNVTIGNLTYWYTNLNFPYDYFWKVVLYSRKMETFKISPLKAASDDFDAKITLTLFSMSYFKTLQYGRAIMPPPPPPSPPNFVVSSSIMIKFGVLIKFDKFSSK